jgi:predicted DNA-binding protein (UPF0251 family)
VAEDGDVVVGDVMPRPKRFRKVCGKPSASYFKPAGLKLFGLEKTKLDMDEFEAIRLVDLEDVSQVEAGEKMGVSQATLSRILRSGRGKIADAVVNGKAILIEK